MAASDEEIAAFLNRCCDEGTFTYEDKRDHLLFNFNDEADLLIFLRNMGDTVYLAMSVCLATVIWLTMSTTKYICTSVAAFVKCQMRLSQINHFLKF